MTKLRLLIGMLLSCSLLLQIRKKGFSYTEFFVKSWRRVSVEPFRKKSDELRAVLAPFVRLQSRTCLLREMKKKPTVSLPGHACEAMPTIKNITTMKKTVFTLTLLAALLLGACESPIDLDDNPPRPTPTDVEKRIANAKPLVLNVTEAEERYALAGSTFADDLFARVCAHEKKDKNVCLSPLSLEIALGMLANGVETEAQNELLAVIAGEGTTIDDMNAWYHKMRDAFETTGNVCLTNALWAQNEYPIKEKFFKTNQAYYDAEVGHLDFIHKTNEARDSICRWADIHTFGCIKELTLPLTPDTRMVIANATWLGALWNKPFMKGMTKKETFTSSGGKKQTVDMMTQTEDFPYAEADDYQLLEMPIRNHSFSMLVALPKKGLTADDIVGKINWELPLSTSLVKLSLPKFNFKTSNQLKDFMPDMGIRKLFVPGALSGINDELTIGFINQDVSVNVYETGTEMAAVTTIGLEKSTSIGPTPKIPVEFNANHAFVFCVRDNACHNILFLGKVEDIGK